MAESEPQIERVETRQQVGHITAMVEGFPVQLPTLLTIEDTYWDNGRKDATVKVPPLKTKPKTNIGV
jgi:hypothetical protein